MTEQEKPKKRDKKPPPGFVKPPPKPKLSKAERRALQEQQKAAKAALKSGKAPESAQEAETTPKTQETKENAPKTTTPSGPSWIAHLPPYQSADDVFTTDGQLTALHCEHLHPCVIETAYLYATGQIRGSNARCRSMLDCFRTLLREVQLSQDDDWRHALTHTVLSPSFGFLTTAGRPHSVSMGNAFSSIKATIAQAPRDDMDLEALIETLDAYERERIDYAGAAIADLVCQKLLNSNNKETLLVYGYSDVVLRSLRLAKERSLPIEVIVADSANPSRGNELVLELDQLGIPVSYCLLSATTYVLSSRGVTKVLLGAVALQSDGSVTGQAGTAMVALAAADKNIPVLVACETYKISNRLPLESLSQNELAAPSKETTSVPMVELRVDLTPAHLVSGVVTELGIVPSTSVGVLLREMKLS